MKSLKTFLVALLVAVAPPAWADSFSDGTNALAHAQTNTANLIAAYNSLGAAAAASPANPAYNVYYALVRLLVLPNLPTGSNFLNRVGFSQTGRNLYHWQAKPRKVNGDTSFPGDLNVEELTGQLRNYILPALVSAESNLGQITDTNFNLFLPQSVTHFGDVTIDYGDVQMLRAILGAESFYAYTLNSWNLNATVAMISNTIAGKSGINSLLTAFPNALKLDTTADFPAARGVFTNAINHYLAASQFIRQRPPSAKRLFNLHTNDLAAEYAFRNTITDLENSLTAPVPIHSQGEHTIYAGAYFTGTHSLRSLLPALAGRNSFIWDSFPDPTLGGFVTGLTQSNLDRFLLKHADAELRTPGVSVTTVYSFSNYFYMGNIVQANDGNFYGAAGYDNDNYNGSLFKITPAGVFTKLYRFGTVTNSDGYPLDGSGPNALVLGRDGNLYGTTAYGGSNFSGTIFKITVATGHFTTLYSFGTDQDGLGYGSYAALVQGGGTDNNFYGSTSGDGMNGGGTLFKISPAGVFTRLYSFTNGMDGGYCQEPLAPGSDGNFYGSTVYAGAQGAGTLFQMTPAGSLTVLHAFAGGTGVNPNPVGNNPSPLVQGPGGVLYGTAPANGYYPNGGDFSPYPPYLGSIFSITPGGTFTTLYNFTENDFGSVGPVGALAVGPGGSFYGVTAYGGANQTGTIFKFIPGGATKSLVWFSQDTGGFPGYAGGLVLGTDGHFYGTTSEGGNHGNGTVYRFDATDAPGITTSPQSRTNLAGTQTILSVSASGAAPLTYHWYKNGTLLGNGGHASAATTANLTLTGVSVTDAGYYYAVVGNSFGTATSAVAVLTIVVGPDIVSGPLDRVTPPVTLGSAVKLTVVATGGSLAYQWMHNNYPMIDNGNISGTSTSNLMIAPFTIYDAGSYSVVVSNYIGAVTSRVATVRFALDSVKPAVTIISPAAGNPRFAGVPILAGTASDNASVAGVYYWLTNVSRGVTVQSGAAVLSTAGSISNWVVPIQAAPGSNVLTVQSADFSGNHSPFLSRGFFLKVPVSLVISANGTGSGTITGKALVPGDTAPALGATSLNIGETYTLNAKPGSNSVFLNWSGSQSFNPVGSTNSTNLTFIMAAGTTIQATFSTNPFVPMAGSYNGLFALPSEVPATAETSGLIANLTLNPRGVYSGKVYLKGVTAPVPISGTFNPFGQAFPTIARTAANGGKVSLELDVQFASVPRTISGMVSGTNGVAAVGSTNTGWTSYFNLIATPATNHSGSGAFTVLIPFVTDINSPPQGEGFALLTNHAGTVVTTGNLADGTALNTVVSMPIAEDNSFPFYSGLYNNTGAILGRLSLDASLNGPVPAGTLTWIKKPAATGIYRAGLTNTIVVNGSGWTNPVHLANLFPTGSTLTIQGPGLLMPTALPVTATAANTLVYSNGTKAIVVGRVVPATGQLTITFTNDAKKVITGKGAILQNFPMAGGYYLGGTNSGLIQLQSP